MELSPRRAGATAFLLILLFASCGERANSGSRDLSAGSWEILPDSPLAARRSAHAFAIDHKLMIVGGTAAEPCPVGADCGEPSEAPFSDGAVYDPDQARWTEIADAPLPIGYGTGAVADGRLYLLITDGGSTHPEVRRAFVSYDPGRDVWAELEAPPDDPTLMLAPAGDDIIAYQSTQENGVTADLIYNPDDQSWSELPRDPLRPSFDRSIVWTDAGLVLLGIEVVPNPGSKEPSFYRAAILDGSGRWVRLPDSEVIGWNPQWSWSAGQVVNASIESADGGEVNGWGRSYPAGGMLDPITKEWAPLPSVPARAGDFTGIYAFGGSRALVGSGWTFDAASGGWLELSRPDGAPESEAAAAWVGDELFVWGGVRFARNEGELLGDGWRWSMP